MLKQSSNKRDFKRLRAKVGRRVAKSSALNKTVKVSSKKLQLAQQLQTTGVSIPLLTSKLSHYSGVARLTGLQEMKNFLLRMESPQEHVSSIIPPALENLFDEELETRKAAIELFSTLFSLCPSHSLIASMPVVVTYIGSGLTNLSRGIRATVLNFLYILVSAHPHILRPFHAKVIRHTIESVLYVDKHMYHRF